MHLTEFWQILDRSDHKIDKFRVWDQKSGKNLKIQVRKSGNPEIQGKKSRNSGQKIWKSVNPGYKTQKFRLEKNPEIQKSRVRNQEIKVRKSGNPEIRSKKSNFIWLSGQNSDRLAQKFGPFAELIYPKRVGSDRPGTLLSQGA